MTHEPITDEDLMSMKFNRERAVASYQKDFAVMVGDAEAMIEDNRRLIAEVDLLRLKTANSLANNLCPDHRDKQSGKTCLACEIERKAQTILRLIRLLSKFGYDVTHVMREELPEGPPCD